MKLHRAFACLGSLLLIVSSGCKGTPVPAASSPPVQQKAASSPVAVSATGPVITPELELKPGQSLQAALEAPFDAPYNVTLSAPVKGQAKSLANCVDYLSVENSIYSAGSSLDFQALRSDGARCDALDMLRHAYPPRNTTDKSFEELTAADLPPGVALTISLDQEKGAETATRSGGSILDVDKTVSVRRQGTDKIQLNATNWTATLTLYARATLSANGPDTLIVRWDARATRGTYASTSVLVLARSSEQGPLHIVQQRPEKQ